MASSPQLPVSSAIYPNLTSRSQTRLVTFHDTRDDGEFEAQLHVVDLDEPQATFQALSYLCGDPTPRSKVHLAGTGTHICVAQNLTNAIERLLRDGRKGPIWIDAISINQDDVTERNQQVKTMTRIYERAHTVLAWVDLKSTDCSHTVSILKRWADPFGDPEISSWARQVFNDKTGEAGQLFSERSSMPYFKSLYNGMTDLDWAAVNAFYDNPYFWRAWVAQEVVSGTQIRLLLGSRGEVEWHTIEWATVWLNTAMADMTITEYSIAIADGTACDLGHMLHLHFLREHKLSDGKMSLQKLVAAFHYRSQDPKDKIFAIAGMFHIPDIATHHFEVDYNRSTWLVYAEAVRGTIKATRKLLFLSFDDYDSATDPHFPSWVPSSHFNDPSHFHTATQCINEDVQPFKKRPRVSEGVYAEIRDDDQAEVLTLLGVGCPDSITEVFELGERTDFRTIHTFLLLRERQAYFRSRRFAASFAEATTRRYAFEGLNRRMVGENVFSDFRAYLRKWISSSQDRRGLDINLVYKLVADLDEWDNEDAAASSEGDPQSTGDLGNFSLGMDHWCSNRNLVLTSGGRFAVGGKGAQVGDSIVVLCGGNMPFVLRPDKTGHYWKRISMIWVPGIMDGELVNDPEYEKEWYSLI